MLSLEETPERIRPVCRLTLSTRLLPAGLYGFFWAEAEEEGLQAGRSIWAEVQGPDGPIGAEQAEQLLHQMVLHGRPWADFDAPPTDAALAMMNELEARIAARCLAQKVKSADVNESRVAARLASLRASTEAKRAAQQRRIDQHVATATTASCLRARQTGQIEADAQQRERELERGRVVSVRYIPQGFGFLRVVAEGAAELGGA